MKCLYAILCVNIAKSVPEIIPAILKRSIPLFITENFKMS